MIYLWDVPDNYVNKNVGEYNTDCSPDNYLLTAGKKLEPNEFNPIPTVDFEVPKKRLQKFDCLPNNTLIPLVNKRLKDILENIAPDDVQFFSAKLLCADGELDNYFFLNVTHTIRGIDHEKSIYTKMKIVDAISGFTYLAYKEGCMGKHQLCRDEEYKGNLLISEKVKAVLDKEHITGVSLVRPEDYFRPLSELI